MSMDLRYTKRPTKKFSEITGCDMLSAAERLINGQIGGYYAMGDEQSYFRLRDEKAQLTIRQFEAKLQKELHPYFFCIFNPAITPKYISKGHQMGFFIPEVNGFVPLCCVGHSGDNIINAHSEGSIARYISAKTLHAKEQAIASRGWVAAFEFAKLFLWDLKETGGIINPNKIMDAREFLLMKVRNQVVGGKAHTAKLFQEMRKVRDAAYDEQQKELAARAIQIKQERIDKLENMTGISA